MYRHIFILVVISVAIPCQAVFAENTTLPKIEPFSTTLQQNTQEPKEKVSEEQVRETLKNNVAKSRKHGNLTISFEQFQEKIQEAGVLSMDIVPEPSNTVYIFTDPKCSLSAKAFKQIVEQQVLFEANKVNVKWLPVIPDGDPAMYRKAILLFAEDRNYQDTTPNQARELIRKNTEIYATSFDKTGTPLVFWYTSDGIDIMLGYPKPKVNNSYLSIVAQKKDFLEWLVSLAEY